MTVRKCFYPFCCNIKNSRKAGVSFHSLAKRIPEVQEHWKLIIKLCRKLTQKETESIFICSEHFVDSDYLNPLEKSKGLRPFAVPVPVKTYREFEIEVGRFEEVSSVGFDRKRKEIIPLNNDGLPPKRQKVIEMRDHDYTMSVSDCFEILRDKDRKINKLRRKMRQQNQKVRQKTRSAQMWKQKAINLKNQLRKALRNKRTGNYSRSNTSPFVEELIKNAKRTKGARYSNKTKNIALSIHYCSNKAYRQLSQHLKLPSISLLKKWIQNVQIDEGISENVLELLKSKAQITPESSRLVSICFDEMTLKEGLVYLANANPDEIVGFPSTLPDQEHADTTSRSKSVLVFMLKGITTDFKQAVGYFFSRKGFTALQLEKLVKHVLNAVNATGFIPKAIICDQNSTNRSLFTKLAITIERPYFDDDNGNRIYGMFDSPHLIKSTRNNLYHHNGVYRGKLITWTHIRKLYFEDVKRIPRAVPKLKRKHVYIPPFGEMRVGMATETLSSTTAAGIKTYVNLKLLPKECLPTANFCEDFDNLFDVFNAKSILNKKEFRRPLTNDSRHWKFLNVMEKRLKKLEFISKDCETLKEKSKFKSLPKQSRTPYFISGWLLNIASLRMLMKELTNKYNVHELATQNLSQDCLENFFCLIRMRGCNNRHPTPFSFRSSYRQVVMTQLLKTSDNSNCEMDQGENLIKPEDFSKIKLFKRNNGRAEAKLDLDGELCNENGEIFDPAELTNVHYTAGWILSTLTHETCISQLERDKSVSKSVQMLSSMKSRSDRLVAGLKITEFLKFIVQYFRDNFSKILESSPVGVRDTLFEGIKSNSEVDFLCNECFTKIVRKYLNMLMKAKLNEMNQTFNDKSKQAKNKNESIPQKAHKLNIGST